MKTSIAILVLILLIVGGAYVYQNTKPVTTPNQSEKIKGIEDTSAVVASEISWKFEDLGEDAMGMPSTNVLVSIQQNTYPVGTYQGSCIVKESSRLNENELSGVLCWFAGSGDEVGVYREGNGLAIKHRAVDEGTAEAAPVEGMFHTLLLL